MTIVCLFLAPGFAGAATATGSATLTWTAPGDDGVSGRAQAYALRYSLLPITEANFNSAVPVAGLPAPRPSGATETFTVTGLLPNTNYFFAIKARDEAFNWSPISNVVSLTIPVTGIGDAPASISFSEPTPNPARGELRFALTLPEAASVRVEAFDITGRRVRVLAGGPWPAGPADVMWDLRDDAGNRVPTGFYLVRARLGNVSFNRRVVVAR